MLKLRLLTGPRAGRQLRVSDTNPISIGRRKGRLRLHDSRVSKNHAEISFDNDVWVLRDLGSANGTYVNRRRAEGLVELEPGDIVQMGRVLAKVVRCDGIGMDTQPGVTDELFEDDDLGIGVGLAEPSGDDDDFDLDAMFGDSAADLAEPEDDLTQPPTVSEPAAPSAGLEAVEPTDDAIDTEKPIEVDDLFEADASAEPAQADEPVEVAVDEPSDEPSDDDDSFFADLAESSDTTDEAALGPQASASDESPEDEDEDVDPFLGKQEAEEETDDTSDQISLDDESGMGPRSAGTTLLTAVPHDDLTIDEDDEDESSGDAIFDADEPTPAHAQAGDEDAGDDDEDDEAPAVVGLHLDHAPPQQPLPEVAEAEASVEEDEPEIEPVLDADPVVDDVAEIDEPAFDQAELLEPTDSSESPIDALADGVDVVEPDHFEVAEDDEPIEPSAEAEIDPPLDELAELSDTVWDQPEDEAEPAALAATESEPESEPESVASAEPAPEPELEPEPVAAAEPEPAAEDTDLEGAPEFDIDAAFDALSEGLDDSLEVPAIGAELSDDDESGFDTELGESSPAPATAQDASTSDALVGSQLDVDFIKEALAKLEGEQANEDPPPKADDGLPQASVAPAPPSEMSSELSPESPTNFPPDLPPAAPPTEFYLPSPPPGLNPSSVNPPTDPRRTYPPHSRGSGAGRWFFLLLLFLCVGGAGGWLISQNYDKFIAGRDDTANPASPISPSDPIAAQPLPNPTPPSDGQPDEDTDATQPTGPNPFAAGPGVLGPDAIQGLTRGADADRPLDPPLQPNNTNNPAGPGTIRQPSTGPGSATPGEAGPVTGVPNDNTTPAADAPPARIVFLVDASGSLVDSLPQMVVWLNQALQTVKPDERFAVYFFKGDEPIAVKPKGMLAPSRELLNRLREDWLNPEAVPLFPSGRSNPSKAITQAMTHNPTDLYLLSDDALAKHKGDATAAEALGLIKQALGDSEVRVHGVQFFYRGDNSILETLANQTDGTFEFVRERVAPNADPIDLLKEIDRE